MGDGNYGRKGNYGKYGTDGSLNCPLGKDRRLDFLSKAPMGRLYVSLGQRPRTRVPPNTQGLKARLNRKTISRPFRAWLV